MSLQKKIIQAIEQHCALLSKGFDEIGILHQAFSESLREYKDQKKSTIEDQFHKDEKGLKVKYTRQVEELKYQHIADTKKEKASFENSMEEIRRNFKKKEKELQDRYSGEMSDKYPAKSFSVVFRLNVNRRDKKILENFWPGTY